MTGTLLIKIKNKIQQHLRDSIEEDSALSFLKIAVANQIDFSNEIFKEINIILGIDNPLERANKLNRIQKECEDTFIANFNYITATASAIETPDDNYCKKRIFDYLNAYYEYVLGYGWSIGCLSRPQVRFDDEVKIRAIYSESPLDISELTKKSDDNMATMDDYSITPFDIETPAHQAIEYLNNIIDATHHGLVRFFTEIIKELKATTSSQKLSLQTDLDDLLYFLNNIQLAVNNISVYDKLEALIFAIKNNNVSATQDLTIINGKLVSTPSSSRMIAEDTAFTPLMLAAKYAQDENIFSQGLFIQTTSDKQKITLINMKVGEENTLFANYNTLMIAARWGKNNIFAYLLKIVTKKHCKDLEIVPTLLKCICTPFLPSPDGAETFKLLQNLIRTNASISKYSTVLDESIFTETAQQKIIDLVNIKTKITYDNSAEISTTAPLKLFDAPKSSIRTPEQNQLVDHRGRKRNIG